MRRRPFRAWTAPAAWRGIALRFLRGWNVSRLNRASGFAVAAALAGCGGAGAVTINLNYNELRKRVTDDMKVVMPHIKPEHLKKCQDLLEQPNWLGAKYKIAGQFRGSIQHSCAAQMQDGIVHFEGDDKVAALVVSLVKVEGAYGTGSRQEERACAFGMKKGDPNIVVSLSRTKASPYSNCPKL